MYSDNTHVTDEDDDAFPVAHSNEFLGKSPSVNVNQFVLVLENFD